MQINFSELINSGRVYYCTATLCTKCCQLNTCIGAQRVPILQFWRQLWETQNVVFDPKPSSLTLCCCTVILVVITSFPRNERIPLNLTDHAQIALQSCQECQEFFLLIKRNPGMHQMKSWIPCQYSGQSAWFLLGPFYPFASQHHV